MWAGHGRNCSRATRHFRRTSSSRWTVLRTDHRCNARLRRQAFPRPTRGALSATTSSRSLPAKPDPDTTSRGILGWTNTSRRSSMSDAGPGVGVGRQAVHQQVVRMLESLERDHPGATAQLARRTVDQLGSWEEVSVRTVPAAQTDAGCSVAGAYIAAAHPPILAIADAVSPRRRAFTGLHELGHHLQQTDYALMEALIELEDSSAFEDAACDEFAAEVLLPAHLVNQALAGGVTAP